MGSMNQPFPAHIFRAYDIRGKVSLLSTGVIDAIAHGLAQQYQTAGRLGLRLAMMPESAVRLLLKPFVVFFRTMLLKLPLSAVVPVRCCITQRVSLMVMV